MARTAKVYLAGAVSGGPGLLTCKALRLLQQTGAGLYDPPVSAGILTLVSPAPRFIDGLPLGRIAGGAAA